jgi:hypothetical protein
MKLAGSSNGQWSRSDSPERTGLFTGFVANSNNEIELLTLKRRYRLGALCENIDTDLAHDGHSLRADRGRVCAGRADLIQVISLMQK